MKTKDQTLLEEAYSKVKSMHQTIGEEKIQNYIKGGCRGHLMIHDIDYIPDTLTHVNGILNLPASNVRKLPDNLTIKLDLNLIRCKKLKVLPKGLTVGATLSLQESGIKTLEQLPDDLVVGGEIESDYFSNEEAKNYLEQRNKVSSMEKKLPELEGIF